MGSEAIISESLQSNAIDAALQPSKAIIEESWLSKADEAHIVSGDCAHPEHNIQPIG